MGEKLYFLLSRKQSDCCLCVNLMPQTLNAHEASLLTAADLLKSEIMSSLIYSLFNNNDCFLLLLMDFFFFLFLNCGE